jgi:hypothetical protein
LNPRPKRVKEEVTEVTEVKEVTPVEEAQVVVEEVTPVTEETQKREKKVVEEKPIPPEELLERPDNALSLAEYREQLKEKNRKILGSNNAGTTLNVELPAQFKKLEKESFGVQPSEKKAAAKPAKKENVVQEVVVNFKTQDNTYQRNNRNDYGNKKSKPAPKIRFEDLPSL